MMPTWLLVVIYISMVLLFIVTPVSVEIWAEKQERKDKNGSNKRDK